MSLEFNEPSEESFCSVFKERIIGNSQVTHLINQMAFDEHTKTKLLSALDILSDFQDRILNYKAYNGESVSPSEKKRMSKRIPEKESRTPV